MNLGSTRNIRALWLITGLVALLSAGLTWMPAQPVAAFGWQRSAPGSEIWRCLSCHFVHLGNRHLFLNIGALAGLATIAGMQRTRGNAAGFAGALLAGMLGVCLGLHWHDSGVQWYVGLSGALFGVFAWLALVMASLRHWPGLAAWGLYFCGLVKALLDTQVTVGALGLSGIPLAPPAHLYGFMGGTLWAALLYFWRARRVKSASNPRRTMPN